MRRSSDGPAKVHRGPGRGADRHRARCERTATARQGLPASVSWGPPQRPGSRATWMHCGPACMNSAMSRARTLSSIPEISAKRLEMLKAAAPHITRLAVLVRKDSTWKTVLQLLQSTGKAMNLTIQFFEVRER